MHLYVLRLRDQTSFSYRDALIEGLKRQGIGASLHFIPVHLHSYYRKKYSFAPTDFPVAFSNFQRMLSLPLSPALSDEQVRRIISAVSQFMSHPKRLAG
jgi:dTDP-4-amino-4,6-dideoxygalactose transaminase